MNNSELNKKNKNLEIIKRIMINREMYDNEMNIEDTGNIETEKNEEIDKEKTENKELNVDDILDIYFPESSENNESPDADTSNKSDNSIYEESKLSNVVFYKEDSDEVIIIRNGVTKKSNNNKNSPV